MAFEPGGRANKLGNRYEEKWVVKQLLRLINEEIRSVTIEAIGDDEKGVDLWVETKTGKKEAHQCKARNGSNESWNITDLKNRGILKQLQFQLNRNSDCEFVFVSGLPATCLGDICESARNSNNEPDDFSQSQVKGAGQSRHNTFLKFCQSLNIDEKNHKDLNKAFDYLRRTHIIVFPNDKNAWEDLKNLSNRLLTGEPETIIAILSQYAENNNRLGNPIYPDELVIYLKTQNIYPKNLAKDSRIIPAINRLCYEFKDSIRPNLIDNELIHREETDKCLTALENHSIVILHGAAGSGKSSVLYEL